MRTTGTLLVPWQTVAGTRVRVPLFERLFHTPVSVLAVGTIAAAVVRIVHLPFGTVPLLHAALTLAANVLLHRYQLAMRETILLATAILQDGDLVQYGTVSDGFADELVCVTATTATLHPRAGWVEVVAWTGEIFRTQTNQLRFRFT